MYKRLRALGVVLAAMQVFLMIGCGADEEVKPPATHVELHNSEVDHFLVLTFDYQPRSVTVNGKSFPVTGTHVTVNLLELDVKGGDNPIRVDWVNFDGSKGVGKIFTVHLVPVDTQPPTIKSSIPEDGAKDVPIREVIEDGITIVFSEPVQPGIVEVEEIPEPLMGWQAEWNGDSVKIVPIKGKDCLGVAIITYTVEVRGVKDAAGNEMEDTIITFTAKCEE